MCCALKDVEHYVSTDRKGRDQLLHTPKQRVDIKVHLEKRLIQSPNHSSEGKEELPTTTYTPKIRKGV